MPRLTSAVWLRDIRLDPKWDEAKFRRAHDIRLEADIEGVSLGQLSQKRQVDAEEVSFSSSQSPKRQRPNDADLDFFANSELSARPVATSSAAAQNNPVTPTRNGGQCPNLFFNTIDLENRYERPTSSVAYNSALDGPFTTKTPIGRSSFLSFRGEYSKAREYSLPPPPKL